MTKKNVFMASLCLSAIVVFQSLSYAQDGKVKIIERPAKCDVKEVDSFVSKSFDSYDESKKITDDINFIKVEGDGKTTPLNITNGKGETLSKEDALIQFTDLLGRAKKQNDNIKTLQDLQKPATESIKTCPMTKKPKATKSLGKGGEALNEVINQTKNQMDLLGKQISDLKSIKDSK
ncbi:MAG: hypothetical protein AB9846_07670 [Tenuifilaceae bacterium]